jgi:hypothetical protein
MTSVSQVEKTLLAAVGRTGAMEMLARRSEGTPSTSSTPSPLNPTGWNLPEGDRTGMEHSINLHDPLPSGAPAPARSMHISKTANATPPGPYYPIDCWDRFAAYPLKKDDAGRVRPLLSTLSMRHLVGLVAGWMS